MDELIDMIQEEVLTESEDTQTPDLHAELEDLRAKLEKAESAIMAMIKGENPLKYSPIFSPTISSTFVTASSAKCCRLSSILSFKPCVI